MTRIVHELVVDALHELADEAGQRRLWLSSGGEVSSFIELGSRLWDDSGLADALDGPHGAYAPEIDGQLRALRTQLHRIDAGRPPAMILDDPRLERARAMANALLQDLNSHDRDGALDQSGRLSG